MLLHKNEKRLERIEKSDLMCVPFYNDLIYWDSLHKTKKDHLGHFFRMNQVRFMSTRHHSLLLSRFEFLYR